MSTNTASEKQQLRGLSLDTWAVTLALALALLVGLGWLGSVPW